MRLNGVKSIFGVNETPVLQARKMRIASERKRATEWERREVANRTRAGQGASWRAKMRRFRIDKTPLVRSTITRGLITATAGTLAKSCGGGDAALERYTWRHCERRSRSGVTNCLFFYHFLFIYFAGLLKYCGFAGCSWRDVGLVERWSDMTTHATSTENNN